MNNHFSMGAINKTSNEYEYPVIALKTNDYKCPHCNREVMLKKGKIKRAHFAHHKSDNPCQYYTHPSESQIHKDAKLLMKTLLDKKTKVEVYRKCRMCNSTESVSPIVYEEGSTAVMEHRFIHNDSNKSADVALINNGNIEYIFEICHSHATHEDARPEPWVELNATDLINTVNANYIDTVLYCCRFKFCDGCALRAKLYQEQQEAREKEAAAWRRKRQEEQEVWNLAQQKMDFLRQHFRQWREVIRDKVDFGKYRGEVSYYGLASLDPQYYMWALSNFKEGVWLYKLTKYNCPIPDDIRSRLCD